MAGAGDLVVRVGIDAAQFTDGLSDAERKAQKFAEALSSGFSNAAALGVTALAGIATGAIAALAAMDRLVKQAGEFQDLAEKTGASAEGLASFATAADVAGTEMQTIAQASVILTKNLASSSEESKGAAQAIKALGLNYDQFKQLAPEDQIEQVSKALAGFEDGASKTAVAVALFGKSGAQLLPFLKELQAEGGRQVILTAQQIKMADDYADSQAKLTSELRQYAQVAAVQALPALNNLLEAFSGVAKSITDLSGAGDKLQQSNAIGEFVDKAVGVIAFLIDAADGVARVFQLIGTRIAAAGAIALETAKGNVSGAIEIYKDLQVQQEKILSAEFFSQRLDRIREFNKVYKQFADSASQFGDDKSDPKSLNSTPNPTKTTTNTGASAIKSAIDALQNQIDKYKELSAVQNVQQDIEAKKYAGASDASKKRLLQLAAEVDAENTEKRVSASSAAAQLAAYERQQEKAQLIATGNKLVQQAQKSLDDQYTASLGPIGDYITATAKLAEMQTLLATAGKLDADAVMKIAAIQQSLVEKLKESSDAADKTKDSFNEFAQQAAKNIQDILGDSLYDAMQGNFKNILSSFTEMINKLIAQAVAADLAKKLFGTTDSKSGDFKNDGWLGDLFKLGSSFFGGSTQSAASRSVGTSGMGFLGSDGAMYGLASGGWLPTDRPTLVGERGPEMVMPAGREQMKVVPNGQMGGNTTIIVNAKDAKSFIASRGQTAAAVAKINSAGLRYS